MECYPLILIGLKSLFVALIIHLAQVPAFDCEQVACSINSGEGESTHTLEDICTNYRLRSPLTRMLAWPLVGATVTLSDVLHSNVNWNFPLLSRSHTSTIFIGIATSVVTNLLFASSTNRGQSRSNGSQNRLNIEVDVNDRQTLSSLSDMLNTTFSNLDIERVSDDIYILNVSAATEIPPKHVEPLRENLEILMKKVTHVYQSLEQCKSLLRLKSTENGEQKQKDEKRDYAKENQEYDGVVYKIRIVILLTLLTVSVLYTWSYIILGLVRKLEKHKTKEIPAKSQKDRLQQTMSDARVVKRESVMISRIIVPRVTMAVVSFNSMTEKVHSDITHSFMDEKWKYPVRTVTVKTVDDFNLIPRSKVALVFIDFNERNIILEEVNQQNTLRLTTVQHIMDIGEMEVIIVYCFDSASDNLEELFAPKLITINTHPVLKKLDKKKCVLSINKEFSSFQKTHLRHTITEMFGT